MFNKRKRFLKKLIKLLKKENGIIGSYVKERNWEKVDFYSRIMKRTSKAIHKILKMEKRKRVYVDMDGTLCDFVGAFQKKVAENPGIRFPQSQYRFWAELEPIPGAIEAFRKLEEKFDVWILTSPSTKNLICYTEKAEWIKNHLGMDVLQKLIISKDKTLLKGDYLIDDLDKHEGFEGELILIHSDKFPDWKSVLTYMLKKHYKK